MVTMRDVAALAGVSQATVSYALNGDPIITESTRAKVLTAARKLNYTVNLSARNLKSGKSGALGLVVQELQNPYVTQLADAVSQYALTKHMQTVIQQTLYRQENETSILEHVTSAFCDAVIFSPSKLTSKQIKSQLNGKPALLLSSRDSNPEYDVLDTPAREAMYTATSYLLETGCRKLLFMGMPYIPLNECLYSVDSARLRIAGFEQALVEHGIEPSPSQFIQPGGWNPAISRAAMLEYLDQHAAPQASGHRSNSADPPLNFDGVVCVNDTAALGVMRALVDRHIRIPQDVSVIGFDGINQGAFTSPSLTTMDFDFDDMAQQAVDMLMLRLHEMNAEDSEKQPPQHLLAHYRLLKRESTR